MIISIPLQTVVLLLFAVIVAPCAVAADSCPDQAPVALQVLGSGGPIADDGRASSAYLVWLDGKSRALVDVGGGAFLRFGEAGADFENLDFIGLSHFHTDHSADLPALLKSGWFSGRSRPLSIAGPGPGGPFPGLDGFLRGMLDGERGAYGYLSAYLDGGGGLARLRAIQVPAETDDGYAITPIPEERFSVEALSVPHGIVPTLAFRVRAAGKIIVFASDQNGSDPSFIAFAKNADLLVMHMAIPPNADTVAKRLHATPGTIGAIAAEAGARTLLLSHFMARSLRDLDGNLTLIRAQYTGPIVVAEDLTCLELP